MSDLEVSNLDHLSSWYNILLSTSLWFSFYFLIRFLFPNKQPEWSNRLVTVFHGILASCYGVSTCLQNKGHLFEKWDNASTHNHLNVLLMSMGYFLFDFLWCAYYNTETKVMMIHHGVTCVATYRMLCKQIHGIQAICGLGGAEATNPFLQLRWFLRTEGFHNSKAYRFTELIFAIAFLSVRIAFGTYFFTAITYYYPYDLEFRVYTTLLYIVSLVFLWDIFNYAHRKYIQTGISVLDVAKLAQ